MSAPLQVPMRRRVRGLVVRRAAPDVTQPDPDARVQSLLHLRESAAQETRLRAELVACLGNLRDGVVDLPAQVRANLAGVRDLATEIALAIARELVGEALDRGLVDPAPAVLRCLESAVTGLTEPEVEVNLHPDDLQLVRARLDAEPELLVKLQGVRWNADAALGRAAVRVETGAGQLAYEPAEVLQRMSNEVRRAVGVPVPPAAEEPAP